MKIKVFSIRIDKKNQEADEENLNFFLDQVKVSKTATQLIPGPPASWSVMVYYNDLAPDIAQFSRVEKFPEPEEAELTDEERKKYTALKQWRADKARELGQPAYLVAYNKQLMSIARVQPQDLEELSHIKGFGDHKIARMGSDIIALMNSV